MTPSTTPYRELDELLAALCDNAAGPAEIARLESLANDADTLNYVADYLQMDGLLRWESEAGADDERQTAEESFAAPSAAPFAVSTLTVPLSPHPAYFSSGWPVAYLIATVVFVIGLAIGALVHVSQPSQVVKPFVPLPSPLSPRPAVVARITAMVDCEWEETGFRVQASGAANQKSDIRNRKSDLRIGDRLALRSGLLEITYDTGARVILQGPVTYEIESPAGGYLAIGKLTAKLEQKAESSSLSPLPSPLSTLFAVRTPTAIVTDLGTEFGVEVDHEGRTFSHVFRGLVSVQPASSDGRPQGDAKTLRANQSARVDCNRDRNPGDRVAVVAATDMPVHFVRDISTSKPAVITLDLADIVAGGNGSMGRRDRGIDPTSGHPVDKPSKEPRLLDDGKYHRTTTAPMIDGVFVPDGRKGPVQIDSAGHTFDVFPATAYETNGHIWAGGVLPLDDPARPDLRAIPTNLRGVECAAPGHGLIFLHANKGITFDLDAMRKANPNCSPVSFHALAANTGLATVEGKSTYADLWVLVDGKARWQRRQVNATHGAFSVVVPLGRNDRFLTLVATDGGDGILADWTMFGDPQIELSESTVVEQNKAKR